MELNVHLDQIHTELNVAFSLQDAKALLMVARQIETMASNITLGHKLVAVTE